MGSLTADEELDVVVVGAGVVGLAIARQLAQTGRDVVVLEQESQFGTHTSSRNSEVIHAGIYYEPESLKARLCVRGKELLYRYCRERAVPHKRIGKLIVATDAHELPRLHDYLRLARANGVSDLTELSARQLRELEPNVRGVGALLSPSTGILDSHALMSALRKDAQAHGAVLLLRCPVLGGDVSDTSLQLDVGGRDARRVRCRTLINAGGLYASSLSRSLRGLEPSMSPQPYYAKGHYFVLEGRSPFQHLVYPLPPPGGLGIHVTLDLSGKTRFGPDVCWQDGIDYSFDESRAEHFYAAIRRYYPALADGSLMPGYTGIRPKLLPVNGKASDFVIQGPRVHGIPGLVQLFGIESPGLTACLAIAEEVAAQLQPS